MYQIIAHLPDGLVDIIRQALERYLEDLDDLSVALERLHDPADPVLDWDQVRHELRNLD